MHYDLIVIGMGLAGLMAARTAVEDGAKVLIAGKGMGCLSLFSSTVDLLGKVPETMDLADGLTRWIQDHPDHPYSKVGLTGIERGISSFTSLFRSSPYVFHAIGDRNSLLPTGAGTLRPAYLIPGTMIAGASCQKPLIVGFQGFRDFHAAYVARPLKWRGVTLSVPSLSNQEISATALSRWMERESFRETVATEIKMNLKGELCVGLPAILGIHDPMTVKMDLEKKTGANIFEIQGLPPSLPGMRIFNRLKEWLIAKGTNFLYGYPVSEISLKGKEVKGIYLHHPPAPVFHSADRFILATGRFIGGGLAADRDSVSEPLFHLPVARCGSREEWFEKSFFHKHPIHRAGIDTDSSLRPVDQWGQTLFENVWIAGTILAGHHSIEEISREGIEIASGYWAARQALNA